MNAETRICQNCQQKFVIEPEDFGFYEKIKVPAPTFCPMCRSQRRMIWRNERSLYKRKCSAPGHEEEVVSLYAPESPVVTYDVKYWWSDSWDPLKYGMDYDFQKPFFEQFGSLLKKVPLLALVNINPVNSEYVNWSDGNKDCYLIFASGWNENVRYSAKAMESKDSQDLLVVGKSELCYECVNCIESYKLRYSTNCKSCTDSYFLYGCRNCNNCFGCSNLVSKSYCIFNKQYSKEEYEKKISEMLTHSYVNLLRLKEKVYNEIYLKSIHKYANIVASVACTGDNINNSKNCKECFDVSRDAEDCKFLYSTLELKDTYDGIGPYKTTLCYETVDNNRDSNNLSTITVYDSHDVRYSMNCQNCSNVFGSIGLRGKQYCILNKQYSKENYEFLLEKIIQHMKNQSYVDSKSRQHTYGDFFPMEISPFGYNETIAQEEFPLTREEVNSSGYKWYEPSGKSHDISIASKNLSDTIQDVQESILESVVGCEHEWRCSEQCSTAFRIISQELEFYRKMNLPLPRLCPNCRHYQRLKQRNPLKLWHRKCQCASVASENQIYKNTAEHAHKAAHCPNEFETSYAPERPEIVYCEQCYQAEVA